MPANLSVVEIMAEAMWSRTHDGVWPQDAEKEFPVSGRGISTATIYRMDAGAAALAAGKFLGSFFGTEAVAPTETEDDPRQPYMFDPPTQPQPKADDWKTKRGL